jgi:hypothetical protein
MTACFRPFNAKRRRDLQDADHGAARNRHERLLVGGVVAGSQIEIRSPAAIASRAAA